MNNKNKIKYISVLVFLLVTGIVVCIGWVYYRNLNRLGQLKGLATSLGTYAIENQGCLPDLDQWMQILVSQGYCSSEIFRNKKHNYAINKHIKGLKLHEIPSDMIVLFEVEGTGNLVGDYELIEQSNYRWPGCAIQFRGIVDNINFFDKKQAKKLNWVGFEDCNFDKRTQFRK